MQEQQREIIIQIRTVYNQFTRAEKKVADYVLGHTREVLFMSITELADACGVGDTSVFRFCRTIGVEGYQDFKLRLSLSMRDTGEESRILSSRVHPEDDLATLIQKVLGNTRRALDETAALLEPEDLDLAVDILASAEHIAFFGVGASLTSAQKAANKFLRISTKGICVADVHMQAMVASTLTEGDAAIVFSYSGATKDTNSVARIAKQNGAKVISVTRFQKSPLSEFADVALLCGANETPLQSGSTGADICQSFLTDLLYNEYYRRNYEECSLVKQKTSSAVSGKLF